MSQRFEISTDEVEKGIFDKTDYRFDLKFYSPCLKNSYAQLFKGKYPMKFVKDVTDPVKVGVEIEDDVEYKYLQISDIDGKIGEVSDYSIIRGDELPSRAQIKLSKNDVVVSSVRPRLREIAIVPKELDNQIGTNGFIVLRCNDIEPKYLHHILRTDSVTDELERRSGSLNYPTNSDHDLLYIQIPYPPENIRIEMINQFERVTSQVKDIKNDIDKLVTERKQVLTSFLRTSDMTNVSPSINYTPDETENNDYRVDVKFYRYSRKHPYEHLVLEPISKLVRFESEGVDLKKIPDEEIIQVTASRSKGIIFRDKKLALDIKTKSQRKIKAGNIVISRIDLYNGCLGIVPKDLNGATVTKDFMVIILNTDKVNPTYFIEVLKDDYMADYFYAFCVGATGRKRITEDVFEQLKIPVIDKKSRDKIKELILFKDNEIQKLQQKAEMIYKDAGNEFLCSLGIVT